MNLKKRTIVGAAIVMLMAVWLVSGCSGLRMTIPDRELYDEATNLVRSDDRENYPRAEKIFEDLKARYPQFKIHFSVWHAQMLLAWSDELKRELEFINQKARIVEEIAKMAESQPDSGTDVAAMKAQAEDLKAIARKWANDSQKYLDKARVIIVTDLEGMDDTYKKFRVLADYYRILGNESEARKNLEQVEKMTGSSAGAHFLRAVMISDYEKDYFKAIHHFDSALGIDPGFLKALFYKGLFYDKLGDKDRARYTMQQVLMHSPGHTGAKVYLKWTDYVTEAQSKMDSLPSDKKAKEPAAVSPAEKPATEAPVKEPVKEPAKEEKKEDAPKAEK